MLHSFMSDSFTFMHTAHFHCGGGDSPHREPHSEPPANASPRRSRPATAGVPGAAFPSE